MTLPLVPPTDPALRRVAYPVADVTDDLRVLVGDMIETMYAAHGVGLAAPQVGRSLRVVVVDVAGDDEPSDLLVMINPVIVESSHDAEHGDEGCLSLPGVVRSVARETEITVCATSLDGTLFTVDATGLKARAIQHEIDHLNGILITDARSA